MPPPKSSARSPSSAEHVSGYQTRDHEIVDYQLYELPGTGFSFRGPQPASLAPGGYVSCVGAAQTFGCFCAEPYPALLARRLSLPVLNLGYGGAGPEFFVRHPPLLDYVNRGRCAIVQVMSGRSQSNSLFESGGLEYLTRRADGAKFGANDAYSEVLAGSRALRRLPFGAVSRRLARLAGAPRATRLAAETRAGWVESYRQLFRAIKVPVVLFWFSKRTPPYHLRTTSVQAYFGQFPQLIDRTTLEKVRPLAAAYVECVSNRGSPQPLVSRFTGKPVSVDPASDRPDLGRGGLWSHNHYYPSPEMHEDAAEALVETIGAVLQDRRNHA